MISLETAQKLKDAGLMWEPKIYDYLHSDFGIENVDRLAFYGGQTSHVNRWSWNSEKYHLHNLVWLPSLSQLLAEIETRGYGWRLQKVSGYYLRRIEIYIYNDYMGCFEADTSEEAVAQALIWILKQEAADI